MSDNTLDTITDDSHPDYRARIVYDMDASEPYNDGGSPILRTWHNGYREPRAEQITAVTSHVVCDGIVSALERWANQLDMFERYLRIFHGTTSVKAYDRNDCQYVTFDTADWRAEMGLTDEYMAGQPGVDFNLASMDEYLAWLDGQCYGIVVEKLQTWRLDGTDDTRDEWDHVDSCWGFYGSEYASERAAELIAENV